ncbi:LAMI_0C06612g1_1 [Lachancea mirantina]|uniref:LAMI_0C06612g1_1 n=1 Tax=Lachancea mirantina TaxID=1230905 RepID=A0A1G4J386_9SACH|nr:LAMI_0C06612g1_1 [Lachancea mirantina]
MKLASIWVSIATLVVATAHVDSVQEQRFEEAHHEKKPAILARHLAAHERDAHVNTVDRERGVPVSFVEYFVGSDACPGVETSQNGNLIFLLSEMSSTFKNWNTSSNASVTLEAHRGPWHDPHHRPGHPPGPPGPPGPRGALLRPRATYFGDLKPFEGSDALKECFLRKHPDAAWWLPGGKHSKLNDTRWLEFDVSEVYLISPLQQEPFFGTVPGDEYHHAESGMQEPDSHKAENRRHNPHHGCGDGPAGQSRDRSPGFSPIKLLWNLFQNY